MNVSGLIGGARWGLADTVAAASLRRFVGPLADDVERRRWLLAAAFGWTPDAIGAVDAADVAYWIGAAEVVFERRAQR